MVCMERCKPSAQHQQALASCLRLCQQAASGPAVASCQVRTPPERAASPVALRSSRRCRSLACFPAAAAACLSAFLRCLHSWRADRDRSGLGARPARRSSQPGHQSVQAMLAGAPPAAISCPAPTKAETSRCSAGRSAAAALIPAMSAGHPLERCSPAPTRGGAASCAPALRAGQARHQQPACLGAPPLLLEPPAQRV